MKKKNYRLYVTDAYFVLTEQGVYDWATDHDKTILEFTSHEVGQYDTVAEALEVASNWGSRWVMYPSLLIEDQEGSEVYSAYLALDKCKCCGKEEWETIVTDLRTMKGENGSRLFPEIE